MSNSAPTLSVAANAEFVGSQLAARLSPTVLLSDADRRTLASASVAITAGFMIDPRLGIVLFLAVDLVSVWTLLYILLSGSLDGRWKRFASALILIAASYFVLNITFTNVAGLACFAGLSAILASAKSYSPSRPLLLAGIALIFIGSLVRLEMLALALPIILAASIFLFRSLQLRMLLVGLAGAALAVVGGIGFDRLYVRAHPDWNLYYFYNKTAQGLQDAHRLGNAGLIIKHISWSKNDQELFARSFFPDPQVYSVERIQFLIDHVPGTGGSLTAAAGVLLQRLINPSGLPVALLVLSVLFMALTGRPSRSVGLAVITVAGASLAENLFLEWFYKDPDYVLFTLLANTAILLTLLLDWPGARNLDPPKTPSASLAAWLSRLALLPILAAVALVANRTVILSRENLDKRSAYRRLLTDLGHLQSEGRIARDAVIISPSHGIPWEWSNPLILEFPPIPFLDTGWITFSPFYEGALRHYGLEPLPQAL